MVTLDRNNSWLLAYCLFAILFLVRPVAADFSQPVTVLSGQWGKEINEFGLEGAVPYDDFPKILLINRLGQIVLADKINRRIMVFQPDGRLGRVIQPKELKIEFYWPYLMAIDSENYIYTYNHDQKLQKYDFLGNLQWTVDVFVQSIEAADDRGVFVRGYRKGKKGAENFLLFSHDGEVLNAYKKRPPALGKIIETKNSAKNYKTEIVYPNHNYFYKRRKADNYNIICEKYIYATWGKMIEKFDNQGESLGKLILPEDQYDTISPAGRGFEATIEVVERYGGPLVAPNGDVYAWKRTKKQYEVIKWVWVDDKGAPQMLMANALKKFVSLEWGTPLQDAETVTGYEVFRSNNLCGPFLPIGKARKDVLQYKDDDLKAGDLFYYQVRAIRDKSFSGFSNRVVGQISK